MAWQIFHGNRPVINDYTGQPKTFPTKEAAKESAELSHYRGAVVKEIR